MSLVLACASLVVAASHAASLQELLSSTNGSGMLLLDQGYQCKHSRSSMGANGVTLDVKEYTHLWIPPEPSPSPCSLNTALLVGRSPDEKFPPLSYRAPTTHRETIPSFERLNALSTIKEFDSALGISCSPRSAWGEGSVIHARKDWLVFTLQDDGSVRVVQVVLPIEDDGTGWRMTGKRIEEHVYRPTGRPPQMEAYADATVASPANPGEPVGTRTNRPPKAPDADP